MSKDEEQGGLPPGDDRAACSAAKQEGCGPLAEKDIARYWLSALVESADDAIVSKTLDGVITSWNKGAERIFGYTAEEAVGKPVLILIPTGRHDEERMILARIRAGERVEHYETIRRRKDGALVDVSLTVSPIVSGDGTIIGASKIARDITHLKRAEKQMRESEERYRTLFSLVPLAIYACDAEGVIQEYNKRAVELWGRAPKCGPDGEKFCGSFKIYYPDGRPMPHERCPMARVLRGETVEEDELEILVERPDGLRKNVIANPQPLRDEDRKITGAINCLYDITERKETEAEREGLLRREKHLRKQAEEANHLKDEFLATVSHELRTPLNAILGWSVMARQNNFAPDVTVRAFDIVERNARNQSQIISDILDVSRIITGKLSLSPEPVRLTQILGAAVDTLRPAVDAKDIRLETEMEPDADTVTGDPDRLQQIFWNLLSNAVKFTPPGGGIKISLRFDAGHAEIKVADTGQGIEPEFLPFVFDRFRQGDSKINRKHGGLGLGLSIVRHLTELHGGTVSVESRGPGTGATFAVRLPLKTAVAAPDGGKPAAAAAAGETDSGENAGEEDFQAARGAGAGSLKGLRVLVVDDDEDALELVRFSLTHEDAEVFAASSADEALEFFDREKPDLLISDIGMPGKDGYDLIREIKKRANGSRHLIPSLALTAYAREEDSRKTLEAGFRSYLPKPVEPSELIERVNELMSERPGENS